MQQYNAACASNEENKNRPNTKRHYFFFSHFPVIWFAHYFIIHINSAIQTKEPNFNSIASGEHTYFQITARINLANSSNTQIKRSLTLI